MDLPKLKEKVLVRRNNAEWKKQFISANPSEH